MNNSLIEKIVPELRDALIGLAFREMIQLAENEFVVAFEGDDFRLLLISTEAREPRIYLIKRRLRDLKKQKANPSKFVVDISKALAGLRVTKVEQLIEERIIDLKFNNDANLVVQLTGKSSNLFLLDSKGLIAGAAKKPGSDDQALGNTYSPPNRAKSAKEVFVGPEIPLRGDSISESLDIYYEEKENSDDFDELASAALRKIRNEINKLQKLIKNLESDRTEHGDAEKWKRFGDLLLANASNAERNGGKILVNDFFDPTAPRIEIEVDQDDSNAEAAQKYFRKYTKSRNAAAEIETRMRSARDEIESANSRSRIVEEAIVNKDAEFLKNFVGNLDDSKQAKSTRKIPRLPSGIRSFISSDGFEILVGKKATDNDVLTFKVANSRDLWMHAADYPGSHVVIRNPDRKEVPQKTLLEAAQLAAFYSQGKKQTKAAVNYTEKKFVNKPKGAAPGQVRLASFKTILVEPIFPNVTPK